MPKIITTSWDDGHPKDLRINELLEKYNLRGTFYIPRTNPENKVMTEDQVQLIAARNEVGGHTLSHVRLTSLDEKLMEAEISGCFQWLKSLLGKDPLSFCFPLGSYNARVIEAVERAGFKLARTTELLSVLPAGSTRIMPTTLQVYEHRRFTYFRHLIKRSRYHNLLLWMKSAGISDILKLTDYYIEHIIKHEGCFHLWGHSWEIENYDLWSKLESIFRHISNLPEFSYACNKDAMDA